MQTNNLPLGFYRNRFCKNGYCKLINIVDFTIDSIVEVRVRGYGFRVRELNLFRSIKIVFMYSTQIVRYDRSLLWPPDCRESLHEILIFSILVYFARNTPLAVQLADTNTNV